MRKSYEALQKELKGRAPPRDAYPPQGGDMDGPRGGGAGETVDMEEEDMAVAAAVVAEEEVVEEEVAGEYTTLGVQGVSLTIPEFSTYHSFVTTVSCRRLASTAGARQAIIGHLLAYCVIA